MVKMCYLMVQGLHNSSSVKLKFKHSITDYYHIMEKYISSLA